MFYFENFYSKKIIKSDKISDAFFTTRDFILHSGSLEGKQKEAESNIQFLLNKLNIPSQNLYRCKQIHSANVQIANKVCNLYPDTDAIILTEPNTLTFLNYADCTPIILYDNKLNIGAVIHAGWKGTAQKISNITAKKLIELGSNPENITALVGACIGQCCFCVNEDVFQKIIENYNLKSLETSNAFYKKQDKYYINLKTFNQLGLIEEGISNFDILEYCTACNTNLFFSYRKENKITARHSAVLKIP